MTAEQGDSVSKGQAGGFVCSRCGATGGQLKERPFRGALGEKVQAGVCGDCWREWVRMGTRVINELGLVLHSPEGQRVYDDHMKLFLKLDEGS